MASCRVWIRHQYLSVLWHSFLCSWTPLTSQLSSDSLKRQLPELLDQRSELGAADQLMFTIVQLIDRHQAIGQNSLHQHTMPAEIRKG